MNDLPPMSPNASPSVKPVANIEFKAVLLLLFMLVLMFSTIAYVLYARGAFERTQELVLLADDSEGVVVGMDMTFSGFPIGRVRRVELAEQGNVRIIIDVPSKDARWLRTSSVFTMESGLVGNTKIRAYSGVLTDPPLTDGSERTLLRGDTAAEIPKLVAMVKDLTQNLVNMTGESSSLNQSLANVQTVTETLKGPNGTLKVLLGNDANAKQLVTALTQVNALLAKVDGLAAKTDKQVFGDKGLMVDAQTMVKQVSAALGDARGSLQKLDAVLLEAQSIASNTKEATTDLGALRAEVDSSLRKVDQLVGEINRKWPFARDTELKLP